MAIKEGEAAPNHIKISRKQFIDLGLTAGGAVLVTLGFPELIRGLNKSESESLDDILREIEAKYGINIPTSEGAFVQYQVCQDADKQLIRCGTEEKSTQIIQNEAGIIRDTLKKIPSAGTFAQLVIPFRNNAPDTIGGGSMMGHNWEYFLDPSKYQNYPQDRYLSPLNAVSLTLSNKKPDEILPPVNEASNFLPILTEASMNQIGLKPANRVDYPWTTYGERLKQVVIHEIGGHGVTEYAQEIKVNHNAKADYDASGMSLFGGIPLDTNNPIISSFAKVNGWMLIPYSEYISQWGDYGKQESETFKKTDPERAAWLVWDRDPQVWGNLQNRTIRLDPYASYGTIKETFATFFMFWSMSESDKRYDKSLLNSNEIKYFDRMSSSLSRNPEKYIKQLIEENPGPTFNMDLFETKYKYKELKINQKMLLKRPRNIPVTINDIEKQLGITLL